MKLRILVVGLLKGITWLAMAYLFSVSAAMMLQMSLCGFGNTQALTPCGLLNTHNQFFRHIAGMFVGVGIPVIIVTFCTGAMLAALYKGMRLLSRVTHLWWAASNWRSCGGKH